MNFKMTVDEALEWVDDWAENELSSEQNKGWVIVSIVLAEEVRRLREAMDKESKELMR